MKWKLEQKIQSFHQDENNCFFDIAIDIITLLPYEEEANIGELKNGRFLKTNLLNQNLKNMDLNW